MRFSLRLLRCFPVLGIFHAAIATVGCHRCKFISENDIFPAPDKAHVGDRVDKRPGILMKPFLTRKAQSWRARSNSTFVCSALEMSILPSGARACSSAHSRLRGPCRH